MNKPIIRKCCICKNKYEHKSNTIISVCENYDCRSAYAIGYYQKQKLAKEKKAKSDWAAEKKVLKEKVKGIPELKKDLEKEINTISRLIDFQSGCISCGGHTTPSGGHYHSVGANGAIRFNLDNIHLQDYGCNGEKGGNIHKYDLGLIERYGKEYWEYVKFDLVAKYPVLKMKIFEYKEKIDTARGIVKWLKLQSKTYTPKERLELRKLYNNQIGIYK